MSKVKDSAVTDLIDEKEVIAMRRKGLRKTDFGSQYYLGKMDGKQCWADGFVLEVGEPPKNMPHSTPRKRGMDFDILVQGEFNPEKQREIVCLGATEATGCRDSAAVLVAYDKSIIVIVNERYFGYFSKRYKDAKFYAGDHSTYPVTVACEGRRVGLIMPYKPEVYGQRFIEKRFPSLFGEQEGK